MDTRGVTSQYRFNQWAEKLVREIREELECEIEVGEFIADDVYEFPSVAVRLITYFANTRDTQPKIQIKLPSIF